MLGMKVHDRLRKNCTNAYMHFYLSNRKKSQIVQTNNETHLVISTAMNNQHISIYIKRYYAENVPNYQKNNHHENTVPKLYFFWTNKTQLKQKCNIKYISNFLKPQRKTGFETFPLRQYHMIWSHTKQLWYVVLPYMFVWHCIIIPARTSFVYGTTGNALWNLNCRGTIYSVVL